MLTEFKLGNFKAFGDTQRIRIRPLTLIYGANSAGKSSIVHGLMLAAHMMKGGTVNAQTIGEDDAQIDLGGYRQYIHRGDVSNNLKWGFRLPVPKEMHSRIIAEPVTTLREVEVLGEVSRTIDPDYFAKAGLEFHGDDELILKLPSSHGLDGIFRVKEFNHDHPLFQKWVYGQAAQIVGRAISAKEQQAVRRELDEYSYVCRAYLAGLVPENTDIIDDDLTAGMQRWEHFEKLRNWYNEGSWNQVGDLRIRLSRSRRKREMCQVCSCLMLRLVNDLFAATHHVLSQELQALDYIGPLRAYPPRDIMLRVDEKPGSKRSAWQIIANDATVREGINSWLGDEHKMATPYRIFASTFLETGLVECLYEEMPPRAGAMKKGKGTLFQKIGKRVEKFINNGEGAGVLRRLRLVDQRNGTTVSHRDVGLGVSQLLPILAAAFGGKDRMYAIEQPEIHVHPKLQAELGDLFIESALGAQRNTFLLETHSEHLLLRIMRRMRETARGQLARGACPVRPGDVAVLFVQPEGTRSIVREMPLSPHGELLKRWPGGFFEEGLDELLPKL